MNKVTIRTAPTFEERHPEPGDLYESTEHNHVEVPGSVYEVIRTDRGSLTLVRLADGTRWSDATLFGPSGSVCWRRLPPGTAVTITVEEK